MLTSLLQENATHIIWAVAVIIIILIAFKIFKFYRITGLDKNHKEFGPEGNFLKEGHNRPIWDYHFFPGLSRIWHQGEWQVAAAATLILIFLFAYLYTKDRLLANLLQITLGVVIGVMIERKSRKS